MKQLKIGLLLGLICILGIYVIYTIKKKSYLSVKSIDIMSDHDNDGVNDISDIIQGARLEVKNKTHYKSAYYAGGYPPKDEGVCTDVVWRAFESAGINLKALIDEDIKNNITSYQRVKGKPDPNIDFRRVPNLDVFLKRKAESLPITIIPGNLESVQKWQAGDIVIFDYPKSHTAIISDKRNKLGIPYLIHNAAPFPKEEDMLLYWNDNFSKIIGHYRWKYE
ncbi:MAG: DUF1287 domain-containing protein [Candidatus Gracilibacteria bacterium]|nr:DUF1287 domain-containing protein [Candidatus Gracilibacteria bacterium]